MKFDYNYSSTTIGVEDYNYSNTIIGVEKRNKMIALIRKLKCELGEDI